MTEDARLRLCSCDDIGEGPCPIHGAEMAAQDRAIAAREDGRGKQQIAGGGTTPSTPPCTPPSPCEMCNGVGFYVSLPGDVISPCPACSEKTFNPVNSRGG